jgi:ABC-type transporter Mla subunit MlaD
LYRMTKAVRARFEPVADRFVPLAERAEPVLKSTGKLLAALDESVPRIAAIAQDIVAITTSARQQAVHIGALMDDANARATKRLAELDQTVDHAVEQAERTGEAVRGAVLKPVREVNAILAGVRTAILTYSQGGRRPSVDHATQDEEMFI